MKLLQTAYIRILHYCSDFAQVKRAKQADDVFKVIRFERTIEDNEFEIIQIKNNEHIHQMLKDPNIAKLYYSTEMIEKFKYLAFIELGIKYLEEHAEFEGVQIGQRILEEKITEEKRKGLNEPQRPRPIP